MSKIQINKLAQLTGHKASVYALSQDTKHQNMLSGAGEGWIVRWGLQKAQDGQLIAKAEGNIYALCKIPQKELVVAGNMNGGIHWINLTDSSQNKNIQHHQRGVFDFKIIDDELISFGGGGMMTRWSIEDYRSLESFQLSNLALRACDYSEQRNELAIASSDHSIYLLDAKDWTIKKRIEQAHENSVFTVKYAPDGKTLWSGGRDAHLKIWDIQNDFQLISSQPAHWYTINDIAFHPKGHLIATASRDKTIKIWDTQTFKLLKVIDTIRDGGHINSVNALYWSSYNNYLISCSDDRSIIIWELLETNSS